MTLPIQEPRPRALDRLRQRVQGGAGAAGETALDRLRRRVALPRAAPIRAAAPPAPRPERELPSIADITVWPDVLRARPTPAREPPAPPPPPPTERVRVAQRTSPEVHAEWARVARALAEQGHDPRQALQYPSIRAKAREVPELPDIFRRFQAKPGVTPTVPFRDALRTAAQEHVRPGVRAVPEPGFVGRVAEAAGEQVREKFRAKSAAPGAPSALPRPEREAERQAEQSRIYGEALGRTPEEIAANIEQDIVDLGADEADWARQIGTMLGDFVDPSLLVAGIGAERAAMAALQRAAAHGLPLARRVLRLSHTPAGAGLRRRLMTRAAHGLATGGPINVAAQAVLSAEEGRLPTVPELLVAGGVGTVAGPALEVAGAAVAAPFGPGAAQRAAARAARRQPLTEQAANLLRAAELLRQSDPERAVAMEAQAEQLFARSKGEPRVARATPVQQPERRAVPERRAQPRGGALERIRRRVAGVIAPEQAAEARAAVTDDLTGAANVRGDRAAMAQAFTERAEGERLVRFRIDMDNFKALNDLRGHAEGDRALVAVKAALEEAARPEDLITLSRVGGDEFAITIRAAEGAELTAIRDRFEQAAERRLAQEGLDVAGERRVGTSIGAAEAAEIPGAETMEPEALGRALDALADERARARKAERAVSQPRAEAVAAAVPPELPGPELLETVPGLAEQVAAAEETARLGGPDVARAEINRLRRDIEARRRAGDLSPEAADDVIDALEGRLGVRPAPPPAPEPIVEPVAAAAPERPAGVAGAEVPPPPPARIEPTPGAAAQRETQPFESLQLEKPLATHSPDELDALEARVLGLRAEAQAKLDNGAVGSTRPFDYDLQVLGDERARRAMASALHVPNTEALPAAPAPERLITGQAIPGPEGAEAVVKNADGTAVRVRYRAIEARDLVTSHDPETFAPQRGYPEGIQERRYHADKVAQEEVARVAQQLDPDIVLDRTTRPTEGPGIATSDGVVLSGNQRTMAIKRAYRAGAPRAAAYREALVARAKEYGLDTEQVGRMTEPVLVREMLPAEALDLNDRAVLAELVARFNDVATKAKDPLADAATRARRLRDAEDVLEHFGRTIEPEQTLRDYLATPAGREFTEQLVEAHVLPRPEAARFVDRFGALTDEGKGVIERMLYAAAIGDPEVAARAPRPLMRRLEHAIPAIVRVSRLNGWDLGPVLREALNLHAEMEGKGFRSIAALLEQGALFERTDTPRGVELADFLDRVTTKAQVTDAFRRYADIGTEATGARQTVDLFEYEPPSPVEAFRRIFADGKTPRVSELEGMYRTARADQHAAIAWEGGPEEVRQRAAALWVSAGELARATDGQLELDFSASPATRRQMIQRARQPRVWVDVRGQVLRGPTAYHKLLHPFRDPGLERIHVLILDDADRILSHTMETSGAVNTVWVKDDFAWRIAARTKRVGGSKVILSHNHPSGDPTPSADDIAFTGQIGQSLEQRGVRLAGQYVINDLEGVWIEHLQDRFSKQKFAFKPEEGRPRTDWTDVHRPLVTEPYYAHRTLISMREVGSLGMPDEARFDVLYLDNQSRAVALEPHHVNALETMETWLPEHMRANGARGVILGVWDAQKHSPVYHRVIGTLRDAAAVARGEVRLRPGLKDVYDLINIADARSAAERGEMPQLARGPGGMPFEPTVRRARRVFEDPATQRAADSGELAPYTPLEPGWRAREPGKRYDPGTAGGEEHGVPQRPGDPSVDVPSRAQIVKDLAEALEVPIRVGKMRQRRALGIYKVKPEAIRVRVANDIETISHEVGHHIETLLFGQQAFTKKGRLSSQVLRPWWDELKPLGKGVSDETSAEGLAEFVRRYMTNPEAARRRAPRFYDFMETTLREKYPEVLDLLGRKRDEYQLWLRGTPRSRLRAHVSTQDSPDHGSIRDKWTRFRTNVIDDMAWVERMVKDLTEGRTISVEDDAILAARLAHGAEGLGAEFIEGKARDFATLKAVGPSLRDVFAPVKSRLDDFRDYSVARRAEELHSRGIETGLIPADVQAVLQELDSPLFRDTFEQLQGWNRSLLTYLRDAGVLSPEAYQAVLENNKAYLPFYRVRDDIPKGAPTFRSARFGHVYSPVKRIKGSGREIIDPFESLVKNAQLYVQIAQRQQVSNALVRLSRLRGAGWWIEEVPAPMVKKAGVTAQEMLDMFQRKGAGPEFIDFLKEIGFVVGEGEKLVATEAMAEEILQVWRPGDWMGEPNVISALVGGKRKWFSVHEGLYEALMGIHKEQLDAWVRWLSIPARTLRAGATLAPEFIGRNPFRDQVQAFITSDYGFKPGFDFVRGLWHMLGRTEMYGFWRAAGGERASLLALDRSGLRRTFRRAVARQGVPDVVYNPIEMLRALSSAMEDATRIGEFARAVGKEGPTKAGLLRAAAAAREVSVDFSRHGAKLTAIRNLSAFWNARLQGYDRMFRAMKQHPFRTLGRIGVGITLPSIALYYVNRDDPDYWRLPQWQRDLFWLIKINGTWVRVPKPFELGIVFGSIPERILEWWDTRDPRRVSATLTDFLLSEAKGVFLPIPNAIQPLIENVANYNLFTGRPLVPRGLEKVAPEAQVGPHTSEMAEQLGRFLDYPPAKIDNLLYAWTGGVGRLASDITTKAVRGVAPGRFGERPTSRELIDLPGPFDIREETPFIRGFVAREPLAQSEPIERFYEELNRTSVAYETARLYDRLEDPALDAWEDAHVDEIDRYEDLRPVADDLAGIRAEINLVRRDPSLSGDEKARQIRDLEREMADLAAEAINFSTGARGRRRGVTRILGGVGDILAGPGAGRIQEERE